MTLLFFLVGEAVDSAGKLEKLGIVGILIFIFGMAFYLWREDMKKRRENSKERNQKLDQENTVRLAKLDLEEKNRREKELEDEKNLKKLKAESDHLYRTQTLEFQKSEKERDRKQIEDLMRKNEAISSENRMMLTKMTETLTDVVTANTFAINTFSEETKFQRAQITDLMSSMAGDMEIIASYHDKFLKLEKANANLAEDINQMKEDYKSILSGLNPVQTLPN